MTARENSSEEVDWLTVEHLAHCSIFGEHRCASTLCLFASSGLVRVSLGQKAVNCTQTYNLIDRLMDPACHLLIFHRRVGTLFHGLCSMISVHLQSTSMVFDLKDRVRMMRYDEQFSEALTTR